MNNETKVEILLTNKSIDDLQIPCLVLPFFSDEKPLKGINGFADWRLNGNFSRQLEKNRVKGEPGEMTLVLTSKRLKAQNVLFLGLGKKENLNPKLYQDGLNNLLGLLCKSKQSDFVLGLNYLLSPKEQSFWVADFILKNMKKKSRSLIPKKWTLLVEEKELKSCFESLQHKFGNRLVFLVENLPTEEKTRKPFTLRQAHVNVS